MHATDPTNASRTLLFDIHTRRWDPELLADPRRARRRMLPEVRPSSRRLRRDGGSRRDSGGRPDRRVTRATSRRRSSARAASSRAWRRTPTAPAPSCVLNTGDRRVISRRGLLTTLCCDARGAAAYALEGSVFVAGAAVQWLRDEMGLVQTAAETGPIAESVPDTRRGLRRAGLRRPRGARTGTRRPAAPIVGPDPRRRARPPRARHAREPRLPEPRRDRGDERGVRRRRCASCGSTAAPARTTS